MDPDQRKSSRRLLSHPFLQLEKKQYLAILLIVRRSYSSRQHTQLSGQSQNKNQSQSHSTIRSVKSSTRKLTAKIVPMQVEEVNRIPSPSSFRREFEQQNQRGEMRSRRLNKMGSVEIEKQDETPNSFRKRAETQTRFQFD